LDTAYDIPNVARYLDFINIMAYDMHGAWDPYTGHHAPLYRSPEFDLEDDALLNVNYSVNYWISNGAARDQLILGMGTYGRGFTLDNEADNGLYAPARNPIDAGPYTREPGTWGYNEICEKQRAEAGQWRIVTDPYYQAPYAYSGKRWVGYDTPESIAVKAQYAKDMNLGGGMIWSLETDDFLGHCGSETYPLIKTIYRVLNGDYVAPPPTTTTTEDPSNPQPTTTTQAPVPDPSDVCIYEGYNADPNGSCEIYWWCIRNGASWTVHQQRCPPGTLFSADMRACIHAHLVTC